MPQTGENARPPARFFAEKPAKEDKEEAQNPAKEETGEE